jgi:NADH-quinone oxidoreductase subunit F
LTANCGNDHRPQHYEVSAGILACAKLCSWTRRIVIAEVKAPGLVGNVWAAFPPVELEGASVAPGFPKYVICNADESEPGTFKDRVLLEGDPHRVLEGLIIAASTINAEKGFFYVRGEYPRAYHIVRRAVEAARAAGYLGKNILRSGFNFEVEVRLGAGAYICGEETAMFESIEGKRGFPRIKPPYPTTHGLFGQPTVINNVETLANLPFILRKGAPEYRRLGTDAPGTVFCVRAMSTAWSVRSALVSRCATCSMTWPAGCGG